MYNIEEHNQEIQNYLEKLTPTEFVLSSRKKVQKVSAFEPTNYKWQSYLDHQV